jgi:serine/threonine protein phosphatase PrpC
MKIDHVSIIGGRSEQQDAATLDVRENGWLLAVFDGHGGAEVSQKLSRDLPALFVRQPNIRLLFEEMQKSVETERAGSTCSMVWISKRFGLSNAGLAILGDSPIIARTKTGLVIPPLHNVRSDLVARVEAEERGALIYRGYAIDPASGDGCQVSRAFGDSSLRFMGHEPDLRTIQDVEWIVIASDGIIESHEVTEKTCAHIIDAMDDGATASKLLPVEPRDNVTIITIRE